MRLGRPPAAPAPGRGGDGPVGLRATGLAVGYRGRPVLGGVELDLRPGEVLALIGPNGSGKTSLLRVLAGAAAPLAGRVELLRESGPEDLGRLTCRRRAESVARVIQGEAPAWPLSARDYAAAGAFAASGWLGGGEAAAGRSAGRALESLGAGHLAERLVTELSGGEFKRVLVARALVQASPVLLLDEPLSDLDLGAQVELLGILRDLARAGRTVALAVHDLNLAALGADRVALLSGGCLAAVGTPAEVITERRVAEAFGARVRVGEHHAGGPPAVLHDPPWLGGGAPRAEGRSEGGRHE